MNIGVALAGGPFYLETPHADALRLVRHMDGHDERFCKAMVGVQMTDASNVIALHAGIVHPDVPAEPVPEVVTALEEMLERAKAGKLAGFTLIGQEGDQAFHASVGFLGTFAMIGALECAKLFLLEMQNDEG